VSVSKKQYNGPLTSVQAANALRAARLNAIDLLDTAEILFSLKRFAHSMAFATLAIEEASKHAILFTIALSSPSDLAGLWKSYRSHRAKTALLNPGIESRIRATFGEIPPEDAKKIGEKGPSPEELEYNKQMAIYSDCLAGAEGCICHQPALSESWRRLSWERICEAQALVHSLHDRTPAELEIWLKHAQGRPQGSHILSILPDVHKELVEKGIIQKEWWDTLLKDAELELKRAQENVPQGAEADQGVADGVEPLAPPESVS